VEYHLNFNHMKYRLITLFFLALAFLQSCKKDIDTIQPVSISLQLEVDQTLFNYKIPFEKANVEIINKTNNEKYTAKANADGLVNFNSLSPGTYSLNVSLELDAEEVSSLSGQVTSQDLHLNYSADNLNFTTNYSSNIRLISSTPVGNWVFKQIYYAGSNTSKGAVTRDLFVEIYNNSDQVLYADSLVFTIVYGKTNNNTGEFLLPNLQFDWSKSLGMNVSNNANEDYVYAKAMFMIPSDGSGKKYPVQPGNSIIIAETAIDHTKPYTLNSDKVQEIEDPTLTVDLSKADFEVYLYPYEQKIQPGRTKFASDIDNPSVMDVETIFATGMRDMVLNPQGKDSYALFKASSAVDPNNFPKYPEPTSKTVTTETTRYPQIPTDILMDALEISSVLEKDKTPRRLHISLDAGSAATLSGPYSSQSVVRRTKQTVNGRRILQDTNNSSKDFGVLTKADPSKTASSFID